MPHVKWIVLLTLALLLAGCAAATPTLAPVPILPPPTAAQTATQLPTATIAPSQTPLPLPTASPTLAVTATLTSTPAPTADMVLAQVKLVGLSWLANYDFLLTFQFPGPVDAKNYHAMMETKDFTCQTLAQYPNRLYCTGRSAAVQQMAWVRLYQAGATQPGFEQYTWIPYFTVDHK